MSTGGDLLHGSSPSPSPLPSPSFSSTLAARPPTNTNTPNNNNLINTTYHSQRQLHTQQQHNNTNISGSSNNNGNSSANNYNCSTTTSSSNYRNNGSLSPSAESLKSSSLLQIPPPSSSSSSAAQPRPSSSFQSLQQPLQPVSSSLSPHHHHHSSSSSTSSVFVPLLPPPPRPLSSPSLSTLVSLKPSSTSTPQLSLSSSSSSSAPRRQKQEKKKQEEQEILRKYSDNSPYSLAAARHAALRVDSASLSASAAHLNNARRKSSAVITSLISGASERDFRLLDSAASASGNKTTTHSSGGGGELEGDGVDDGDLENPNYSYSGGRVKFLLKDRAERGGARLARWWFRLSSRERYLAVVVGILFVACIAFIFVAFPRNARLKAQNINYCLTSTCVSTAAQLMAAMDKTADPCEDFFQYACGQWNQRYVIPEDEHSYNTFEKLHDELQIILRQLLEEEETAKDSNATLKVKDFYRSCTNMTQINHIGDSPLVSVTEHLGGWPIIKEQWNSDSFALETVLGKIRHEYNVAILIGLWVEADDKNSSAYIIQMDQPSLGMPDREYYMKAESESEFIQAYVGFMRGVVRLMGAPEDSVEEQLQDLLEFETELANATRPRADRHDTSALYNKMTVANLQRILPQFNWLEFLRLAVSPTITSEEEVLVLAVGYFNDMINLVANTDKRTVANYLIWRVVMMLTPELTDQYQEVHNKYKMVLHGVKRGKIRWKKCVEDVNKKMGLAVGAMFIRDNFRVHSKQMAMEMIQDIRNAFNELLEENDWMDEETKSVAKAKADAMNARIGYPDFITDAHKLDAHYAALELAEHDYFRNILAIKKFDAAKKMANLRKPVRKEVWEQAPAEINAFYNPNANDILFPAGILQPLFYSEHFPKSLNYGGIGVVIGHEITHGFDDKGRQYDIRGNLAQWWDNATIEAFWERTECMVDQYSQYTLSQTGHHINGKQTQGENIADNGGLKQAYRAYRKWVEQHGPEPPLPGIGLNHDQLFFLNYAQIWCGKVRDEEALIAIRTSEHSPGPIRVLGPLSNSLDFSKAFSCPAGSRMNPHHKCSVW